MRARAVWSRSIVINVHELIEVGVGWLKVLPTPLDRLVVVERRRQEDHRGFFSRFFCGSELSAAGYDFAVAQMNHTLTRRRGSARGLHFQHPPHAEDKLVSCLRGQVFDVAVDLRKGSPTFLKWHGELLSADNAKSFMIPKGFAHGFQALSDDCELLYLHSQPYAPAAEDGLNMCDPAIGIEWPLEVADISDRDKNHAYINNEFIGI